jgi:hypothetical protein
LKVLHEVSVVTRSKVFIASSSEGLDVAKEVRLLLLHELDRQAEVEPWKRAFEMTASYIESLEKEMAHADFAILILTPDDVTISRQSETFAPRDNVIFELGLFMGRLGRERCFIIQEDTPGLKLPSDLLGIQGATFARPSDGNWKATLDLTCALIAKRVIDLKTRDKLSRDEVAVQEGIRTFCEKVTGAWWQRITVKDVSAVSFFRIQRNTLFNSLSLSGSSYDDTGTLVGYWESVMARIGADEKKVLYSWKGWHSQEGMAHDSFHGFGEMDFEGGGDADALITRGRGRFWKVDEAHPGKTIVTPIQLRRITEKTAVSTMTSGTEKDVRMLIIHTLAEW